MALVDAWDKATGRRLDHLVPEHFIGHPVLGANLAGEPPRESKKAASSAESRRTAGKEKDHAEDAG
jgi:hypothetical protein